MKKLLTFILLTISLYANATTHTTTADGDFDSDAVWSSGFNFANTDTLIINNNIIVSGNINLSSLDLVIYVNEDLAFGNPSFLKLGDESTLYLEANIIGDGSDNNNDKLQIGSTTYNEDEIESFVKGTTITEGGALPVELLYFDANVVDDIVIINWLVASETINDYFSLYASKDGIKFDLLDTIKGRGTTNTEKEYFYTDTRTNSEFTYYKLSQTDYDGTIAFFNIVRVNTSKLITTKYGFKVGINENVIDYKILTIDGKQVNESISGNLMHILITDKRVYKKIVRHN